MPLYELVCIAQHYARQITPLQTLLKSTSTFIHDNGGCVRRVDSWGTRRLPSRMRKDGAWHTSADYWTMQFDTNPVVIRQLNERLQSDPRVLRWTTLRRGVTLPEVTANADGLVSQTTHFPESAKYDSAWKDAVDKAKLGTPAPRANLY